MSVAKAEQALVRRMLGGDEAAFEEFCASYVPPLVRFARRRLDGDEDLAREIVQSTVCKVITKLGTFRGEAAFTTWLCACCRNEIAAHFRRGERQGREVELNEDELGASGAALDMAGLEGGPEGGPELRLLRRESAELVHDVLDALPPHYGRALEWKYLDNLPVVEIAARLGLGPKAAESLLTRAREAFRRGYARLVGGVAAAGGRAMESDRSVAVES